MATTTAMAMTVLGATFVLARIWLALVLLVAISDATLSTRTRLYMCTSIGPAFLVPRLDYFARVFFSIPFLIMFAGHACPACILCLMYLAGS